MAVLGFSSSSEPYGPSYPNSYCLLAFGSSFQGWLLLGPIYQQVGLPAISEIGPDLKKKKPFTPFFDLIIWVIPMDIPEMFSIQEMLRIHYKMHGGIVGKYWLLTVSGTRQMYCFDL